MQWIYCDIDGCGEKWRLAISRQGVYNTESGVYWYFPVEDFEDFQDNYSECKRLPCLRPDQIG